MEVAVVAMGVMQGVSDQVVDVVPVRDRFVDATGRVPAPALHRGAGAGADPAHLEPVLVGVPFVRRVEMAVVQVVRVVPVSYLAVAAAGSVPVLVVVVLAAGHGAAGRILSPGRGSVNHPGRSLGILDS